MLKVHFLSFLLLCSFSAIAQITSPDSLKITQTRASQTDSNIPFELAKHYVFYNPTTDANREKSLLVYLPGSFDSPQNSLLFPSLAANMGYHVVSLKYENGVAAKTACSNSTDSNCYANYRNEIITGEDLSDKVEVDITNSIENRLLKLITYLSVNRSNEDWDEYLENGDLAWSKIIVAGHSQGGGHAAYIGLTKPLKRVLMFSAPNDWSEHYNAPAKWTSLPKTADVHSYFAFGALYDDISDFSDQYKIWQSLGLTTRQDTTSVDENSNLNVDTRVMYTKFSQSGLSVNHNATVRDSDTPLDANGMPLYLHIWEIMLGTEWTLNIEKTIDKKVVLYPNPARNYVNTPGHWRSYIIYNSSGIEIASSTNIQKQLYVGDLKKGLYYLKLESANNVVFAKFMKN